MKYKKFDVVIVPFPFVDKIKKQKIRPAVIVSENKYNRATGLAVVAMITSAKKSKFWNDIAIKYDFLNVDCVIRMKFANFAQEIIIKKIGDLNRKNAADLDRSLVEIFCK